MNTNHLNLTALALLLAFSTRADVLELKNGQVLNGKYVGGTAGTLRFETSGGIQVIETSQAIALTFTTPPVSSASAAAGAPTAGSAPVIAPAPAAPAKTVTIPAGSMLLVRMADDISSRNSPGASFTTKLEYNLVVNGSVAIPAGTLIYGKVQSSSQARRAAGRSTLDLRLTQVALKSGSVAVVTSGYQQAGQASIAKAARGAAAGAAIGAIVDGGDGAGKGAAIGATAGALTRGQTITVTPGTLLEFTLTQPVPVAVAD